LSGVSGLVKRRVTEALVAAAPVSPHTGGALEVRGISPVRVGRARPRRARRRTAGILAPGKLLRGAPALRALSALSGISLDPGFDRARSRRESRKPFEIICDRRRSSQRCPRSGAQSCRRADVVSTIQ
jgi:hypothetical protein